MLVEPINIIFNRIYIPRHIHAQFNQIFGRFNIAHVHYPHIANTFIVGHFHLRINQSRMCAGKPEIIVRATPVRKMIVNAMSAFSGLFSAVGKMTNIAVIIVGPHQRHIFRHLQARFVHIQHFFVRNKNLRNLLQIRIHIIGYHFALRLQNFVKCIFLFLQCVCTQHFTIVHTTNSQSINIV